MTVHNILFSQPLYFLGVRSTYQTKDHVCICFLLYIKTIHAIQKLQLEFFLQNIFASVCENDIQNLRQIHVISVNGRSAIARKQEQYVLHLRGIKRNLRTYTRTLLMIVLLQNIMIHLWLYRCYGSLQTFCTCIFQIYMKQSIMLFIFYSFLGSKPNNACIFTIFNFIGPGSFSS